MKHQKQKTMKQTFAIDLRNNELTAADLLSMVRAMSPGVDDPDEYAGPYPHPVNAITVVLMSAALVGTIDTVRLKQFTGYSRAFISAIKFNMENSRLWSHGRYDAAWLSSNGAIHRGRLVDDVDVAMGWAWMPKADSRDTAEPCEIYWDERGHSPVITIPTRAEKVQRKMRYHD